MEALKLGSRGDNVVKLQKKLGIAADGIFGNATETMVKAWQKANGLTVDGIVGPKTWERMFGVSKAVSDIVLYNPLSVHISKLEGRQIKYLAIHYTAGGNSKPGRAMSTKKTFESRKASADFVVDDGAIVQFNPDLNNYYCWAVGDDNRKYSNGGQLYGKATNRNTISIEVCSSLQPGFSAKYSNHAGWYFTDAVIDNTVRLAKLLMQKYDIPIERVVRHYDITGKNCPGVAGWNGNMLCNNVGKSLRTYNDDSAWQAFKERLTT